MNAGMSQGTKGVEEDGRGNPEKNARSCRALSAALSDIVRRSANVDFRDRCFELSRSGSSSGARAALAADLLSIISRDNRKKRREMTEDEAARDPRDDPR